jgi:hypothetical protein
MADRILRLVGRTVGAVALLTAIVGMMYGLALAALYILGAPADELRRQTFVAIVGGPVLGALGLALVWLSNGVSVPAGDPYPDEAAEAPDDAADAPDEDALPVQTAHTWRPDAPPKPAAIVVPDEQAPPEVEECVGKAHAAYVLYRQLGHTKFGGAPELGEGATWTKARGWRKRRWVR